MLNDHYVAHVRKSDGNIQTVKTHLLEVATICKVLASKINVPQAGELIGLMHDFGKYSTNFQNYIKSATGLFDPDNDENFLDAKVSKGKIDHSSAGAQWIWQELNLRGKHGEGKLCGQILALCIASHHSGLIDCLRPDGVNGFKERIDKSNDKTHLQECIEKVESNNSEVIAIAKMLADAHLLQTMLVQIKALFTPNKHNSSRNIQSFYLGFWTRFLFSCLIDADRISSADFENPGNAKFRDKTLINWAIPINRMEAFLTELAKESTETQPINKIRRTISGVCKQRAFDPQGIYTLTVPTGGGKTYASLRYAMHHANHHKLERIIYVIPYTSIIEQNAAEIRSVIEREEDLLPWVLEHHCNLEPDVQTWHSKLASENWDAPIVLTTMVQFLETLFSGGTRGVRRLHQLAKCVIIFDEIQTLPIRCTHLFCNALNFLSNYTNTTVVLCTATQPLLDKLEAPEKGQLWLTENSELIPNVQQLFKQLERVQIVDKTKNPGWSEAELIEFALQEYNSKGSCLVIVNTKAWAQTLYMGCGKSIDNKHIFHLSTGQCPAHRQQILRRIRKRLRFKLPVLCISTQLIEAGVNIDFASVIRFLAGMDSIAQAAGRCNRNGLLPTANVYVVNPANESISQLIDIKVGQAKTRRVLDEIDTGNLLSPEVMNLYFKYYFFDRAAEMGYPLSAKQAGQSDFLLNLLSENSFNPCLDPSPQLRQSFMTAGNAFKAIDAPTQAVIVPYKEGKQLITELCCVSKQFDAVRYHACLKMAQKFSVNVFPRVWDKLIEQKAVFEIHPGEGVFYLHESFYSQDFGLATEIVEKADICIL